MNTPSLKLSAEQVDDATKHFKSNPEKFIGWSMDSIYEDFKALSGLKPLSLLQDALKDIEYVIVGSWALYLHGLLNRAPVDIDIVTKENFYHTEENFGLSRNQHGRSDQFQVGDRTVKAFMLSTGRNDEHQCIDVFHSDGYYPEFVLALVNNKWVKIEKVSSIIEVKKQYIASNMNGPDPSQLKKHQGDLDYILSLL